MGEPPGRNTLTNSLLQKATTLSGKPGLGKTPGGLHAVPVQHILQEDHSSLFNWSRSLEKKKQTPGNVC
jgi:hypothetical protein